MGQARSLELRREPVVSPGIGGIRKLLARRVAQALSFGQRRVRKAEWTNLLFTELNMVTSSEHAFVLTLLDTYSRSKYRCFLSEFYLNKSKRGWILCFRPSTLNRHSPNRYAYRYLTLRSEVVANAAKMHDLPGSIVELLDKELPGLGGLE